VRVLKLQGVTKEIKEDYIVVKRGYFWYCVESEGSNNWLEGERKVVRSPDISSPERTNENSDNKRSDATTRFALQYAW
jgi:hypothetical protein